MKLSCFKIQSFLMKLNYWLFLISCNQLKFPSTLQLWRLLKTIYFPPPNLWFPLGVIIYFLGNTDFFSLDQVYSKANVFLTSFITKVRIYNDGFTAEIKNFSKPKKLLLFIFNYLIFLWIGICCIVKRNFPAKHPQISVRNLW